ncbi:MAG TPA: MBL fold metallo-hydrolase [Nevskiaceae bacterium]|nr:MBL fold metallo-hydrolase [Nevskiaceae bacterium]
MKKAVAVLALIALGLILALASTFLPATLPAAPATDLVAPEAHPPEGMKLWAIEAGTMQSQAGFAYRGGKLGEPRTFGMGGILVEHPQGRLLFDAGFGRNVDQHFRTIPWLMQAVSQYRKETPVADQLKAAGIDFMDLKGVVLTHAHWDHVSGLQDMPGVPVWVPQAELDFINSGQRMTSLIRSFGAVNYHVYDFPDGAYLGFAQSYDVFDDGSVVLVPAPGHTPGSIIAFITLPDDQRYALLGDLVWQREGIELPAEKPWMSRNMVDNDAEGVREAIVHLHQIHLAFPDMVMVPAHDRRVWDSLPQFHR